MKTLTNEFKAAAAKYNCYPINGIPKFYFDDEYLKNGSTLKMKRKLG